MIDHPVQTLEPLGVEGFRLTAPDMEPVEVRLDGGVYGVSGRGTAGWRLLPAAAGGFRLLLPGCGDEASLSMPPTGNGDDAGNRTFLMRDGRLFRMKLGGPRDPRYELTGWEVPGAYLVARPQAKGYRIRPEPASGGIDDLTELLVLFGAELLAVDYPVRDHPTADQGETTTE